MSKLKDSKFLVPNFFTGLNLVLAVSAIWFGTGLLGESGTEALKTGAYLVILCVLFDKVDGFAARSLKASSEFGAQFDSLADLIAFGIAPATIVVYTYKEFASEWYAANSYLVLAGAGFYVITAAMRLAKYNVLDANTVPGQKATSYFGGLPSPMSGGAAVLFPFLFQKYDGFEHESLIKLPLIVLAFLGVLMVSKFLFPKVKGRKNKIGNLAQMIGIVIVYAFGLVFAYPEVMFSAIVFYMILGAVVGVIYGKNEDLTAS